jgi:hypothetical protein
MVATIEPELRIAHGLQVQVGRCGGPRLVGEPGTPAFVASDMVRSTTPASPATFWNGATAWRQARVRPITVGWF